MENVVKLLAVRIENFRSIIDSDWFSLSHDNVTVLVGQNESGKSSVLQAIFFALGRNVPSSDDFRISAPGPRVQMRVKMAYSDIKDQMDDYSSVECNAVKSFIEKMDGVLEIVCLWKSVKKDGKKTIVCELDILGKEFPTHLGLAVDAAQKRMLAVGGSDVSVSGNTSGQEVVLIEKFTAKLTPYDLAHAIWQELPMPIFFSDASGRLPSSVDIDEDGELDGAGAVAASNFLKIAKIELAELLHSERRTRENILTRANNYISEDFNKFWSQTIGGKNKLSLKCDLEFYDNSSDKAGRPHLVFWICDGQTQLYPKQRSQGVVWFLSFYLQLKAGERARGNIFLLDEPGSNLHARAQADVLRVIDSLSKNVAGVIYTTHSPELVQYSKLYRVLAVQRDGAAEDSPSTVIDAHRLGTASSDTLSPILSAMGADLSSQQVIKKKNNVILEEMSGFYYLSAIWKLLDEAKTAHFIAATGVNKIEPLVNMFLGWGLEFVVAIDDDGQGRDVFNRLKRNLYGDDATYAAEHLIKLPSGAGIEDLFSREDFLKHVIGDNSEKILGSNSDYLKRAGKSKPVLAFVFFNKVNDRKISLSDFDVVTVDKMKEIVTAISLRLD